MLNATIPELFLLIAFLFTYLCCEIYTQTRINITTIYNKYF